MTDPGSGAGDVPALDAAQLDAYFALMEAVSLLQHRVEQQLHAEGDLSYVQFQLLARLAPAPGQLSMTELADGVVYSRSGLTYQGGPPDKTQLTPPAPPAPPAPQDGPEPPAPAPAGRPAPPARAAFLRQAVRPPQHIAAPSLPVTAPIPGLAGRRVSSCMRGQRFPARYRYCTVWSRWR